ncbi:DUF2953 domain-containing protein [Clostridium sardiniense]|uniref:DUF2953 domain-containing protein n=1 Tax=Clostridium sardiniense TaxID=29369 RepID=UPI00195BEAD3|nr:hypothetical protein [Clostridium sardiniense]
MKILILLLSIIFIIFLIPLPIKVSIFYSNKDYYIKLYKYEIISKGNRDKTHKFMKNMYSFANTCRTSKFKEKFSNIIFSKNFFKIIVFKLKKNKYKPKIKFNGYLNYSLGDSSDTALFYGVISSFAPFLYRFLCLFFKVKKSNLSIEPIFKDSKFINLNYKSIIFISLGQIIYICIIFIKSILKSKEVSLLRGNYD